MAFLASKMAPEISTTPILSPRRSPLLFRETAESSLSARKVMPANKSSTKKSSKTITKIPVTVRPVEVVIFLALEEEVLGLSYLFLPLTAIYLVAPGGRPQAADAIFSLFLAEKPIFSLK
jgi:hypothetical protein